MQTQWFALLILAIDYCCANHYIIYDEQLGSGKQGTVYSGIQTKTKEMVAIKTVNEKYLPALNKEFDILSKLDSLYPTVPKLFGYGTISNTKSPMYAMAMELLGMDLESVLDETKKRREDSFGGFKKNTCTYLARQLIELLEKVHDAGVVHSDLKPSNLAFRLDNLLEVCLIDFGVAYFMKADESYSLAGTPEYMSFTNIANEKQDLESFFFVMVHFKLGFLPWDIKTTNLAQVDNLMDFAREMYIRKLVFLKLLMDDDYKHESIFKTSFITVPHSKIVSLRDSMLGSAKIIRDEFPELIEYLRKLNAIEVVSKEDYKTLFKCFPEYSSWNPSLLLDWVECKVDISKGKRKEIIPQKTKALTNGKVENSDFISRQPMPQGEKSTASRNDTFEFGSIRITKSLQLNAENEQQNITYQTSSNETKPDIKVEGMGIPIVSKSKTINTNRSKNDNSQEIQLNQTLESDINREVGVNKSGNLIDRMINSFKKPLQ